MATELLALVIARGGSKGLPRKNARLLGDLPLLGWTAEALRQAKLGCPCWLSTEDAEIAQIGASSGLAVPFLRPPELATDQASAVDVALHALAEYERLHAGNTPRWLLLLQPTSPFRPPRVLQEAFARAQSDPMIDGVLGVRALHRSMATLFRADQNGNLTSLSNTPEASTRRQDHPTLFTPNGALYLIRTEVLRRSATFFPERLASIPMNQTESLDIDDPIDWTLAEAIASTGLSWRHRRDP